MNIQAARRFSLRRRVRPSARPSQRTSPLVNRSACGSGRWPTRLKREIDRIKMRSIFNQRAPCTLITLGDRVAVVRRKLRSRRLDRAARLQTRLKRICRVTCDVRSRLSVYVNDGMPDRSQCLRAINVTHRPRARVISRLTFSGVRACARDDGEKAERNWGNSGRAGRRSRGRFGMIERRYY